MSVPFNQRLPAWPIPCPGTHEYAGKPAYAYTCRPEPRSHSHSFEDLTGRRFPAKSIGGYGGKAAFAYDPCGGQIIGSGSHSAGDGGTRRLCKSLGTHAGLTSWAWACCVEGSSTSESSSSVSSSSVSSASSVSVSSVASSSGSRSESRSVSQSESVSKSDELPVQLCGVYHEISSSEGSSSSASSVSASSVSSGSSGEMITSPCCSVPMPATIKGRLFGATGNCACLNGVEFFLRWDGVSRWRGPAGSLCSQHGVVFSVGCDITGHFTMTVVQVEFPACTFDSQDNGDYTCEPFYIAFNNVNVNICCTGTVNVEFQPA